MRTGTDFCITFAFGFKPQAEDLSLLPQIKLWSELEKFKKGFGC